MGKSFVKQELEDVRGIFRRLKRKDFSGNKGQAIKNSSYQLATTIIAKVGSLFFTIIIARLLMPELFGLYSLALGTIILFSCFSDLGVGAALTTFISKKLGEKNKGKAKAYFKKLLKTKIYLTLFSSVVLILLSYYVSTIYYNKPIFFALLAGGLYIPFVTFLGFLEAVFHSDNKFKFTLLKEIVLQVSKFLMIPLVILFLLKNVFSNEVVIFGIILSISLCYLLAFLFLAFFASKKISFLKSKKIELTKIEKDNLKKFIIPLSTLSLSGLFFGYIDTIMLGHFVTDKFIGYYGAAFGLIGSAIALLGFIGTAMFPLFGKLKGRSLKKGFNKSRNFIFLISVSVAILTFIFAQQIVLIVYGVGYATSILLLRFLSILLILVSLSGIYSSYIISQRKTKHLATLSIGATILNILLNWIFITNGLQFGMREAVIGACIATVISRASYFIGLVFLKKRL